MLARAIPYLSLSWLHRLKRFHCGSCSLDLKEAIVNMGSVSRLLWAQKGWIRRLAGKRNNWGGHNREFRCKGARSL